MRSCFAMPRRLSAARIHAARGVIDPAFLDTPSWRDPGLARALGCDLVVKDETGGLLGCFKGRGADLFVATGGTPGPLICASAGNFGLALADAGRRRGAAVTVFVATTASPLKVARIREQGAEVIVYGDDFDAAKTAARAHAAEGTARFIEDGDAIAISEGAGTIATELEDGLDAVVIPVGNGALIAGIATWLRAHRPATQIIGVCAAAAPVMRACWELGLDAGIAAQPPGARAATIADGIAVRVPVPTAVADLAAALDDLVTVEDSQLLTAMRAVHAATGIAAEPSAVAGIAAIAADRARFAGRRVATVLTGANLAREQHTAWLA